MPEPFEGILRPFTFCNIARDSQHAGDLPILHEEKENTEMKPRIAIVLGAIFALAIAVPAFAQYSYGPV